MKAVELTELLWLDLVDLMIWKTEWDGLMVCSMQEWFVSVVNDLCCRFRVERCHCVQLLQHLDYTNILNIIMHKVSVEWTCWQPSLHAKIHQCTGYFFHVSAKWQIFWSSFLVFFSVTCFYVQLSCFWSHKFCWRCHLAFIVIPFSCYLTWYPLIHVVVIRVSKCVRFIYALWLNDI